MCYCLSDAYIGGKKTLHNPSLQTSIGSQCLCIQIFQPPWNKESMTPTCINYAQTYDCSTLCRFCVTANHYMLYLLCFISSPPFFLLFFFYVPYCAVLCCSLFVKCKKSIIIIMPKQLLSLYQHVHHLRLI